MLPREVPAWDSYYMGLTFMVRARSKDPSTQHGAVVIDASNRPLGIGYNGALRQVADFAIDWSRPAKYPHIIHAEVNAINHVTGGPDCMRGGTMFVTGKPCPECMKMIALKGIVRVVYGPIGSASVGEEPWNRTREVAKHASVVLQEFTGDLGWLMESAKLAWKESGND